MTFHFDPRGVLEASGLSVADRRGWQPCPLSKPLRERIEAAARRGEVRIVDEAADGFALTMDGGRHRVIVSTSTHREGRTWAHLSVSRSGGRLPAWPDLVRARDVLLGDDVEAYQVAPPRSRYVNRHQGVLHLWACLDGPALPDFTAIATDGQPTI